MTPISYLSQWMLGALDGDVVLFILLYTKDNSYFCKRYFKKRRIWT